jgi:hypothetical protein
MDAKKNTNRRFAQIYADNGGGNLIAAKRRKRRKKGINLTQKRQNVM